MSRKDIDMYDDDVYENIIDSIPDETMTLKRTLSGTVSLNRRGIFNLATRGMTCTDIAKCFGVSDNAIQDHFKYELNAGRAMIGPRLKQNLLRQAMATDKPNPQLLLFALKNYTELREEPIAAQEQIGTQTWTVTVPVFKKPTSLTAEEQADLDAENES